MRDMERTGHAPSAAKAYSCLISLYKDEKESFLSESLGCIIRQTIPPEEILIVKDGPLTEGLETILSEYDDAHPGLFSYVCYSENRGLWYALSQGVPACRNEIIMRMDVDDWSAPNRAEKELAVLERHPEIGCVGSIVTEFEGDISHPISLVKLPERHEDIVRFGKRRCPFRHPSLMFRRSAVLAAGNYQEMPYFEDYDLYMRLVASGCVFYNIQESLVYMRTSQDFYARRGNLAYMRYMLNFKGKCLERGDFTLSDYFISMLPHAVVCLMPNAMRAWIYNTFLRAPVHTHDEGAV